MSTEFDFTENKLERISRKPTEKREIWRDSKYPGLVFVLETSGTATFAWYRKVFGTPTWKKIGHYPECSLDHARAEALGFNQNLLRGNDPFTPTSGITLRDAFERYAEQRLSEHAKHPEKAVKAATWQFNKYLSAWRERKLDTIKDADVGRLQRELRKKHGLYTSNRVMQFLRAVLNHAIAKKLWSCKPEDNPVAHIELYKERKRTRFLQPDEIKAAWRQLDQEGNLDLRDFIVLDLSTGARKMDLLSMRWEDVNQDATGKKFWRVPDPKSDNPYNIALIPQALEVLEARHRRNGKSPWVFPSATSKSGHVVDLKKSWCRFRKQAGFEDVRVHDLRRTLGSWQTGLNSSMQIVGKSLGHASSSQATEVYAQLNLEPVRNSVQQAFDAMSAMRALPE